MRAVSIVARALGRAAPLGSAGSLQTGCARLLVAGGMLAWAFSAGTYADEAHEVPGTSPAGAAPTVQKECPVAVGSKIDPDIFSIYEGKRVYFCCRICKSTFEKNPGKYLHRLPQFASAGGAPQAQEEGHEHAEGGVSLAKLIEPMGIATLSLVALTVCLGLLRRVRRLKPRLLLKWHKRLGVATLVSGAVHASLVLLAH